MKALRAFGYVMAYFILVFIGILVALSLVSSFSWFFFVLSVLAMIAGSTMIYGLQMDRPHFLWPMVGFYAYLIQYNIRFMFDGGDYVNIVYALIWFGFMLVPALLIRQIKRENQRQNNE